MHRQVSGTLAALSAWKRRLGQPALMKRLIAGLKLGHLLPIFLRGKEVISQPVSFSTVLPLFFVVTETPFPKITAKWQMAISRAPVKTGRNLSMNHQPVP